MEFFYIVVARNNLVSTPYEREAETTTTSTMFRFVSATHRVYLSPEVVMVGKNSKHMSNRGTKTVCGVLAGNQVK